MRTAKTLIRLGGCPGWSESSLGALILLILSCRGLNHYQLTQQPSDRKHPIPRQQTASSSTSHGPVKDKLSVITWPITRGPLVLYRSPARWGYAELEQTWKYMSTQCCLNCTEGSSNTFDHVIQMVKVNPGSSFEKSPRAWAYNHLVQVLTGTLFWWKQKSLSLWSLVACFKKKLCPLISCTFIHNFMHVYSPWAGADNPLVLVWFDFCFRALQHILGHFGRSQLT